MGEWFKTVARHLWETPADAIALLAATGAIVAALYSRSQARSSKRQFSVAQAALEIQKEASKVQEKQTLSALEIAERSTKAAEKSAEATKSLAETGQRAWVSVIKVDCFVNQELVEPLNRVLAIIAFRNGGNSPALDFVNCLWFELREHAPAEIDATALQAASAGVVGPHEPLQLESRAMHLTSQEWADVKSGVRELLLYGLCRYKDVFNATHHTRWCFRFMWATHQFAPWISELNTMD
jgi:hypothetical protein